MEIVWPASVPHAHSPELRLLQLRKMNPMDIVRDYSAFSRERFSNTDGLPVIVPAFNEEHDLPSTLLALARSNIDIRPIVIDNGSNDATSAIANRMGAISIKESEPSKVRATQEGLNIIKEMGYKRVLFTDADTLMGKKWAASMYGLAEDIDTITGGIVTGSAIIEHGGSFSTDALRSINCLIRDVYRHFSNDRMPMVRGFNYLLVLDDAGLHYDSVQSMPSDLFPGEDFAIRDRVMENGGILKATLRPETLVFTRGDRYRSLSKGVLTRFGLIPREASYLEQYQDLPLTQMYRSPYE
jgi:glycosyltransferase involved in cell wall biosynthesis